MTPDPAVLKAVRSQCDQAEEHLRIACDLLRRSGWPETATELARTLNHLRVWTMPEGWLDHAQAAPQDGPTGKALAAHGL
jgi:hypothetical protein